MLTSSVFTLYPVLTVQYIFMCHIASSLRFLLNPGVPHQSLRHFFPADVRGLDAESLVREYVEIYGNGGEQMHLRIN